MDEILHTCKYCGAPGVDFHEAQDGVTKCHYCGNLNDVPDKKTPNELAFALNNADNELFNCRFEEAKNSYAKVVTMSKTSPQGYFGRALAKFRIKYLRDLAREADTKQKTGQSVEIYQPICYGVTDKLFSKDPDYLKAMSLATTAQKVLYAKQAAEIDDIVSDFRTLKANGSDYDVFICCKVTDGATGQKTRDSNYAHELYNYLEKKGIKPFYSERNVKDDSVGASYEAVILHALYSAKSMLIVCSNEDWLDTPWVKNEYMRFLTMTANGYKQAGSLTFVYDRKPLEELPNGKKIQGIDRSSVGADDRIVNFVRKFLPHDAPKMKICANCGTECSQDIKFCQECGSSEFVATRKDFLALLQKRKDEEKRARAAREEALKQAQAAKEEAIKQAQTAPPKKETEPVKKICTTCGTACNEDTKFCPECGGHEFVATRQQFLERVRQREQQQQELKKRIEEASQKPEPTKTAPKTAKAVEQPVSTTAAAPKTGVKYCSNCGAECGANDKFCPECGGKSFVASSSKYCSACGAECKLTAKFCPGCGGTQFVSTAEQYEQLRQQRIREEEERKAKEEEEKRLARLKEEEEKRLARIKAEQKKKEQEERRALKEKVLREAPFHPVRTGEDTYAFGMYPRSDVTDSKLIDALNGAAGKPVVSDTGIWKEYSRPLYRREYNKFIKYDGSPVLYCDVDLEGKKYRGVYQHRNAFSAYKLYEIHWFEYEPIEWRALEEKDGEALLLANEILDCRTYREFLTHEYDASHHFNKSDISKFLNGEFFSVAFGSAEGIQPVKLDKNEFKVLLAQPEDIQNSAYGFDRTARNRVKHSTDYANCLGSNGGWWLRDKFIEWNKTHQICKVGSTGKIEETDGFDYKLGVVPLIRAVVDADLKRELEEAARIKAQQEEAELKAQVAERLAKEAERLAKEELRRQEEERKVKFYNDVVVKPTRNDKGQLCFGTYPRSVVKNKTIVTALNKDIVRVCDPVYGWKNYQYGGSACAWYLDKIYKGEKYRGVRFDNSFRQSDYKPDETHWFKYEPIEWVILEEKDDVAFVRAKEVLEYQRYHHTKNYPSRYADTDMCRFVNEDFCHTAFVNTDFIKPTTLQQAKFNAFLLSDEDVCNAQYGFADASQEDNKRDAACTDYANCLGAYKPDDGPSFLTLRYTDGQSGPSHVEDGTVCPFEKITDYSNATTGDEVVPAMYVYTSEEVCKREVAARRAREKAEEEERLVREKAEREAQLAREAAERKAKQEKRLADVNAILSKLGSYPQTHVTDPALVSKLDALAQPMPPKWRNKWTEFDFYINYKVRSYAWFIDVECDGSKYRGVFLTERRPNVTSGKYNPDRGIDSVTPVDKYPLKKAHWFKWEPIEWQIVRLEEKRVLVTSARVLEARHLTDFTGPDFSISYLCRWLNVAFSNEAFGDASKQRLLLIEGHKVSLLSQKEITKTSVSQTDYACCLGCTSDWWGRDCYVLNARVYENNSREWAHLRDIYGVRPALLVKTD